MICDCYKYKSVIDRLFLVWLNLNRGHTYSQNDDYNNIDDVDTEAINAFFVTNYRDDQIDITTKKLLYYYDQPTTIVNAF